MVDRWSGPLVKREILKPGESGRVPTAPLPQKHHDRTQPKTTRTRSHTPAPGCSPHRPQWKHSTSVEHLFFSPMDPPSAASAASVRFSESGKTDSATDAVVVSGGELSGEERTHTKTSKESASLFGRNPQGLKMMSIDDTPRPGLNTI